MVEFHETGAMAWSAIAMKAKKGRMATAAGQAMRTPCAGTPVAVSSALGVGVGVGCGVGLRRGLPGVDGDPTQGHPDDHCQHECGHSSR